MKAELQQHEAINIIFDAPPSHESGRFVEVENDNGESIKIGEWIEQDGGFWALRITADQFKAPLEQKDES